MPRGTAFTDSEKGKIIALKDWMFRAVIQNFLKDPASLKFCEAQVIRQ